MSAAGVLLAADLSRPPAAQLATRAAIGAIHVYQSTLSPLYARTGVICRFKPTCSHYGEAVVREFGVVRGGWMALKRVLRCGPWTPMGTEDPPLNHSITQSLNHSITQSLNDPITNAPITNRQSSMNRQSSIGNHQWTGASNTLRPPSFSSTQQA